MYDVFYCNGLSFLNSCKSVTTCELYVSILVQQLTHCHGHWEAVRKKEKSIELHFLGLNGSL